MRIIDIGMTINLDDADPRVARVRAVLFDQPAANAPVATLWVACLDPQREVLITIANHGEISQADLEMTLGIDAVALRGRLGGLAKIAKRLGVEYPIKSVGSRREIRRFSLDPEVARQVLFIYTQSPKGRKTP